jgi:hypothetical protein
MSAKIPEIGRLHGQAPELRSWDDASMLPRPVGVGRERLISLEVLVALDG